MVLVWVLLAVAFLAAEAAISTAFFAFFMALGFAAAAIASGLGAPLAVQLLALAVVDVAGLVAARPPLVRRMGSGTALPVGGVSGLAGQNAITADEVGDEHNPGHALLAGERWLAVSASGVRLPPRTAVVVIEVRGTTLFVRPAGEPAAPQPAVSAP